MKKRYQIEKYTILFAIGGMAYFLLEVLVRGYSHYSMFFMWWGHVFLLLWASKRKCKDQDKFY